MTGVAIKAMISPSMTGMVTRRITFSPAPIDCPLKIRQTKQIARISTISAVSPHFIYLLVNFFI